MGTCLLAEEKPASLYHSNKLGQCSAQSEIGVFINTCRANVGHIILTRGSFIARHMKPGVTSLMK